MSINMKFLTPEMETRWDAYVDKSGASFFHYSRWRHLIKNVFGHDSYYLYLTNVHNQITGILPLIRLKSILFGDFLISMPYFNYGGVVADSIDDEKRLLDDAEQLRVTLGCSHVELRETVDRTSNKLAVKTDKVMMLLNLPDNPDVLWRAIGAKRRNQINKASKSGPEFVVGGIELLDEFYAVFSNNMRDLGTPVYSKKFFRSIIEEFPENVFIAVVRFNGQPAGTGFLIGYKYWLEIPWASTLRKYHKYALNMFLYWQILQTAIEKGYRVFDFGRSSKDSGTLKFKSQWGAAQEQLYWNYLMPNGENLPEINPNNPKYDLAIKVWKKLPLFVANVVGPPIVKRLP